MWVHVRVCMYHVLILNKPLHLPEHPGVVESAGLMWRAGGRRAQHWHPSPAVTRGLWRWPALRDVQSYMRALSPEWGGSRLHTFICKQSICVDTYHKVHNEEYFRATEKPAATWDWTKDLWIKLSVLYHLSYGHHCTSELFTQKRSLLPTVLIECKTWYKLIMRLIVSMYVYPHSVHWGMDHQSKRSLPAFQEQRRSRAH